MNALGTAGDIECYHRRRRTKVREHWVCIPVMLSALRLLTGCTENQPQNSKTYFMGLL